ncbi:YciE/YciF family protein [Agaricicola taiwanensis]|uniref:YciE/YciF family protein n=1 Tax=Agaricicola taiwanensis TaxID=591372 RepID=A0A8J2YN69_9RHOB|nr:ferritin-like domain-containing protein [Agaricicola taiwanensis]GGE55363.1 YciE/YciF family protein [Agaricicola taiwanensis]
MADTMTKQLEIFSLGLRNAHSMENEALSIMEAQVKRLEHYPALEQRLREHIEETKVQKDRLDQILKSVGDSNSSLKDMAASVMGSMAAMGHTMAGDEILKNSFADFAFENFEIAAYRSLITMAEASGHTQHVSLLQASLDEEIKMASWLEQNLPDITQTFLAREVGDMTAKR